MLAGVPKEFTATGDIDASGVVVTLKGCLLTGGSALATAVIRSGGSGGTIVATIKAAIDATQPVPLHMNIQKPHLTLTGAGATFTALL